MSERPPIHEAVLAYYDELRSAYRIAWGTERNLSIHYGYFDAEHRSHDAALMNMNRKLAEIAEVASGERVLDAGCGVGGSALWLAEHRQARVTGINIVHHQIELAREMTRRRQLSELVDFELRDFCNTGLAPGSFDVVWGIESICHALDKGAFVAEAARLLKPGGRLVVADGYRTAKALDERQSRLMELLNQGWATPDLASIDGFRELLESNAFTDIRFMDFSSEVMPSARRIYRTSLLSAPLTALLYRLGIRSAVQRDASLASRCQYPALREGLWVYGVYCAVRS